METKTLNDLEFYKVLDIIKRYSSTIYGNERISFLKPLKDQSAVEEIFAEIDEFLRIFSFDTAFSIPDAKDIREFLAQARLPGSMLLPKEILKIVNFLNACLRIKEKLITYTFAPLLKNMANDISDFKNFTDEALRCIDSEGNIRDNATSELDYIRLEQKEIRNRIVQKLEWILQKLDKKAIDGEIISIRDGRYVIPIRGDFKGHIKGLVLDYSITRTTIFVEPFSIVDLNSQLKQVLNKEKEEIERILKKLTSYITVNYQQAQDAILIFSELDSLYARARYELDIKGTIPLWNREKTWNILSARHPVLDHQLSCKNQKIISNTIKISADINGMILTGPNAGGKTVCLKMFGLIQLMAQSGIPVPAENGTSLPFCNKIYTDIGDFQSIENSLSTFSAHISNLNHMINEADDKTLILIDELGTGTDPNEGAALGMAILDIFTRNKVFFVITTHLNNLKVYAEERPYILKASMEFDENKFLPTFALKIGIPGRSYAYEIAQRIGIDADIVSKARGYYGQSSASYEALLAKYQQQILSMEKKDNELTKKLSDLDLLEKEIKRKEDVFINNRQEFLESIAKEKENYMQDLKRQFLAEMEKLRETASISGGHRFLTKVNKENNNADTEPFSSSALIPVTNFNVNEPVLFKKNSMKGTILKKLDDDRYVVSVGGKEINAHAKELIGTDTKDNSKSNFLGKINYSLDETFKPSCDIRGYKSDEALDVLEKYLDSAKMSSLNRILIIHGKGTGKLREVVNIFLKSYPDIKNFHLADYNEGGAGATLVEF